MTIYLPLDLSSPFPSSPSSLAPATEPSSQLQKIIKSILKSKRIAVVCGAGISVQAGIPDFRSSEGLFKSLKRDNPTLSSGKDLFDASVFNSEVTTSLFYQMIAQLSELSDGASPTSFHKLLRALDDRGKLLRVYTQNIDALEQKSGLTFGVPELDDRRFKPRSKGKPNSTAGPSSQESLSEGPSTSNRLPSPPVEIPKCIPLHGTLQSMHCQICLHSFPLQDFLESLSAGSPPTCPECLQTETTRQLNGKRSRGVGRLRPSVVLYNEMHKDGEQVGEVVRRDLVGNSKGKGRAGADLLLVVGTSLRVPGTKRIVREFSKAVRSRTAPSSTTSTTESTAQLETSSELHSPTASPRRTPVGDEEAPVKVIYLNLDFPVPTREWEGVFDVWIRGDAQLFAQMLQEEIAREERAKEVAAEKKRQREEKREEAAAAKAAAEEEKARLEAEGALEQALASKKRKSDDQSPSKPAKRRKGEVHVLLTPPASRAAKKPASQRPKKSFASVEEPMAGDSAATKLVIRIPPRPSPSYVPNPPPRVCSPVPPLSPPDSPLTPVSSSPMLEAKTPPLQHQASGGTHTPHNGRPPNLGSSYRYEFMDGDELSELSEI